MTTNSRFTPSAVIATPNEMERATAALVTAFTTDPFIRWMFPDGLRYLTYFPQVLKHFAGRAFDHSSAYRSEDFAATALWLPPGIGPDEEALGAVLEKGVDDALRVEVFAMLEKLGSSHPEADHWYLPAIGVDPRCHGMGYGSFLLERGLEVCDRNHVAAYLETTSPLNIPLYQRFGFEVIGEVQVGSSPIVNPMFRAAR